MNMFWTKGRVRGLTGVVLSMLLASGAGVPFVHAVTVGSFTVVKTVVNDNGGTAVAGDFTLTVNDSSGTPIPVVGNAAGSAVAIAPGTYSVTEPPVSGYTASFSADCLGSYTPGDVKTCVVTNDDDAPAYVATTGTLVVIKKVIDHSGEPAASSDFTLNLTQGDSSPYGFPGDASGTVLEVSAGAYSVTEVEAPGNYYTTYSADCAGTMAVGETKTCTVTNDNTPGVLTVKKRVINDDGGSAVAGDFSMLYSYENGDGTSTLSFYGSEEGVDHEVFPGRLYQITESDNTGNGYAQSFSDECSGKLLPGESKTCTVTNDDQLLEDRGKITIIKRVVNAIGGNTAKNFTLRLEYSPAPPWPFTVYPATVSEASTSTVDFPGDEGGTSFVIDAKYYRVIEPSVPSDYTVAYSEGCSGVMTGAGKITCTVTNTGKGTGGPGWSPGIMESYNPFTPAPPTSGGSTPTPSGGSSSTTPIGSSTNTTTTGTSISQFSCAITESEARYIGADPTGLLGLLGRQRDTALEDVFNAKLTSRVAPDTTDPLILGAVRNYVTYGTLTTKRLGAGERAGTVASFKAAYGRLPADICDWQNVLRLANTKLPQTRVSRDLSAASAFKTVYGRDPNFGSLVDAVAQSLMGYGVRPQVRDMNAERLALSAYRRTFGKTPSNTDEWDANRAMAYSGVTQRWLSSNLAVASSRILAIDGLGTAFALK